MANTAAAEIFETNRLLKAWSEGDETALERPVPIVDAELRRLARYYLLLERPDHILQTTALVNIVSLDGESNGREAVEPDQGNL